MVAHAHMIIRPDHARLVDRVQAVEVDRELEVQARDQEEIPREEHHLIEILRT